MSDARRAPFVLFVAAAGPRCGFGHLVRAGVLADALGAARHLVLRGPVAARDVALAFGWTVHQGRRVAANLDPDAIVVDDPTRREAEKWVRLGRAAGIPVVVVRDGGAPVSGAALVVDGNLAVRPADRPARVAGPAFALLDPHARALAVRRASRVLIALGGGTHVRRLGADLAAAIVARRPGTRVDLARGFTAAERLPALPAHCRWVEAPHGLSRHLAAAGVAVVAGGVTLHEACALGSPIVAVPVVPAQRRAIAAAALAGAALTPTGRDRDRVVDEAARLVARLLDEPHTAVVMARRASRLVDGLGASRVAARVRLLLAPARREGWRDAA